MTNPTLTDRVRRLAEFDKEAMRKAAHKEMHDPVGSKATELSLKEGFACGARWQHARLRPLIEELLKAVEALEIIQNYWGTESTAIKMSNVARKVITQLEAAVGKMEVK